MKIKVLCKVVGFITGYWFYVFFGYLCWMGIRYMWWASYVGSKGRQEKQLGTFWQFSSSTVTLSEVSGESNQYNVVQKISWFRKGLGFDGMWVMVHNKLTTSQAKSKYLPSAKKEKKKLVNRYFRHVAFILDCSKICCIYISIGALAVIDHHFNNLLVVCHVWLYLKSSILISQQECFCVQISFVF